MKIGAVISEYNPFHNGHKYQIETIKAKYDIDKIVIIMSGDFTERGEPAIIGKELRSKFALMAGADLVLQLPVVYSTGGAELFSFGAVSILNRLNCIDYLFFGAENDDTCRLTEIAIASISCEDKIYEASKKGITYANARSSLFPEYSDVISSPNNILAIEYIKSLIKLKSNIIPVPIKRTSDNYNSDSFNDKEFASAKAIRTMLINKDYSSIQNHVPSFSYEELKNTKPVFINDFSDELYYSLLKEKNNLDSFLDINEDLKNRIIKNLDSYNDFSSFTDCLKTKNYTYTRIQRGLLHILLGIKGNNDYYKSFIPNLSHIKMLGFNKSSVNLLTEIDSNSSICLCNKIPDIYNDSSKESKELFDLELTASCLYSRKAGNTRHEYQRQINIINL